MGLIEINDLLPLLGCREQVQGTGPTTTTPFPESARGSGASQRWRLNLRGITKDQKPWSGSLDGQRLYRHRVRNDEDDVGDSSCLCRMKSLPDTQDLYRTSLSPCEICSIELQ